MKVLRLGTRASKLALVQAESIADLLRQNGITVEIKKITTTGDRITTPLAESGGKALFVKELEDALLAKHIDIAVHSLKDVPGFLPKGLTIAFTPKREDPRDVFLSSGASSLEELPAGATLGTSSPRRRVLLQRLRPDLNILPMRGNVDTRIKKLETGEFDAIVLAAAGLHRLGILNSIAGRCADPCQHRLERARVKQTGQQDISVEYLSPEKFIPAVGQGTLAIETRENETALITTLRSLLNDEETWFATQAERALLQTIGGDCHTPVGAYAKILGEKIELSSFLADPEGEKITFSKKYGLRGNGEELGTEAGKELLLSLRGR